MGTDEIKEKLRAITEEINRQSWEAGQRIHEKAGADTHDFLMGAVTLLISRHAGLQLQVDAIQAKLTEKP